MATTLAYRVLRGVAIGLGAALTGYSAWLSWTHFGDPTGPIAAVTGAGLFVFGEYAWHGRQRLRAVFLFGLGALALVISGTAVLQRVSATQETRLQGARSDNLPKVEAEKALADAKAALAAAEAAAQGECTSGRGRRCTALEEREEAARKRVTEARTKLVGLGAHRAEDPGASVLAALLPISAAQYQLAAPALLPIWLELTAPLLVSIGLAPRRKAKPKPKKKRRKKKAKPRKSPTPSAKVLPFKKAS